MPLPKRKKNDINIYPTKIGKQRVIELMNDTNSKNIYTNYEILIEDLDGAIYEYFKNGEGKMIFEGKEVPTFIMPTERWAEFEKTWQYTNEKDKVIEKPFILVRRTKTEKGRRMGDGYNIAQQKKFNYVKVVNFDGDETGFSIFKVAQPTNIDITYEIMLLTNYMYEKNIFDEKIYHIFNSIQAYIKPKGNYMPFILESNDDDNTFNESNKERIYIKKLTIKLLGFIQSKEHIEEVPTIRRNIISFDLEEQAPKHESEPEFFLTKNKN